MCVWLNLVSVLSGYLLHGRKENLSIFHHVNNMIIILFFLIFLFGEFNHYLVRVRCHKFSPFIWIFWKQNKSYCSLRFVFKSYMGKHLPSSWSSNNLWTCIIFKCLVFFSKILLSTSAFLPIYDIFVTSYPHLRSKKSSFKKFEAFFIIWKNSTMLYIAFTYTYLELFYCNLCDIKYVS